MNSHHDGPILGAPLWRHVMDRAGDRCECRGECGRKHHDGAGRCVRETSPARRVVARAQAATLPAEDLYALCGTCHASIDTAHRAARAAALAEAATADSLF